MPAHKHAALMAEYAKDALETDTPWKLWQFRASTGEIWRDCKHNPAWEDYRDYRHKPRTININGYEVPEPVRDSSEMGEEGYYYIPSLHHLSGFVPVVWYSDCADLERLHRGLVHLTKEAAQAHAEALLSITRQET